MDPLVIVVTGASRGLGRGLVERFRHRGHLLGVCARSPMAAPDGTFAVRVDVSDGDAVHSFGDQVVEHFGRVDLWINNAAVLAPITAVRDLVPGEAGQHFAVNVGGVLHGSQWFIRHVRSRGGGGVLVNISSGAARTAYAGWGAYCASKSAVDRLTEVIDLEERDADLCAYAVAPGVIDTDMQALIRDTDEATFPQVERFRQMKRDGTYNSPSHVADQLLELYRNRPDGVIRRLESEPPS